MVGGGVVLAIIFFPSHSQAPFLQKLGTMSLFRCSYIISIQITTYLFVVSLMMYSSAIYCCLQNFPNTTLKLIYILLDLNAWFVLLVVPWYLIFNGFFRIRQIGPNLKKKWKHPSVCKYYSSLLCKRHIQKIRAL